ncbi:hypothetical protein F2Q68_00019744 [Brassica cretica]|uniref:TIR domain-containing protein n=1 Tax=Brassica cretica TaxID=69181 RepID=A0A8S9FW56_BRACR|nr:hypothetical protein F2Q68_00019744 [Brassica cretica]
MEINAAIKECSAGIAVFSPRYCDSYFCLHELTMLMESKKRVIPIFCDVKPSELCVKDDRTRPAAEIRRFRLALEEAKYTVGLTFDTSNGDWSEFLAKASDAVTKNLLHVEEARLRSINPTKNLKPGDKLFVEINAAIKECSAGIAVFSPRYCDSYFCLHELTMLMESNKRVIPIFCDVKPSELCVKDDRTRPAAEIRRFRLALEEAKYTVGLTFDTSNGDWSEFLAKASDAVTKNLLDVEEARLRSINPTYKHIPA